MGFNAFSGAAGQDFSDLLRYTGERSEGRTADAQDCGAYSPEQLDAIVGPQRRWSWVEIDLSAIRNNVAVAKRRFSPGTRLMAVVKANAYGHGAVQVARTALSAGATQLAVATVSEGIQLRKAGIDAPVLVLSEPPIAAVPLLLRYNLMPSVYTSEFAVAYGEEADRHGLRAPFHLAINTGMNRIGVRFDEAVDFVRQIAFHRALEQVGTFTHFATADCAETLDFNMQLRRFKETVVSLRQVGVNPGLVHCANSAALLRYPETHMDMARLGISMYGFHPCPRNPGVFRPPSRAERPCAHHGGEHAAYERGRKLRNALPKPWKREDLCRADRVCGRLCTRSVKQDLHHLRWPPLPPSRQYLHGPVHVRSRFAQPRYAPPSRSARGRRGASGGRANGGVSVTIEDLCDVVGTIPHELCCALSLRMPKVYLR